MTVIRPANAAMVVDSFETAIGGNLGNTGDGLQPELFPLSESPITDTEPVRTEAPSLETAEQWITLRHKILTDFGSRISPDFRVPDGLRERTEFWFDIYTRYGEAHHIIHHALYPWIIFENLDTTEMLVHGKGPRWLRRDTADKFAVRETARIRKTLYALAKRSDYSHLNGLERELFNKLVPVKGPRRKVFFMAAENTRSQLGQRDFFQKGLVNSSRYLPYMEEEFKRLGLPIELTRMPFVESSFNEQAFSKVGASGIWQIMPSTGKAYMIVNNQIDERNSPLKATRIAGRLLHSYNHALNSWPLAITSYNYGIGNIQKAIHHAQSRDLATIISRYHEGDFKFASSNFFTCFLAALYAEKYNELTFKEVPREPLQEQEVVKLNERTQLTYLKRITGLSVKDLMKYNLDLKPTLAVLPSGYQIHLPPGLKERLVRRIGTRDKRKAPRAS